MKKTLITIAIAIVIVASVGLVYLATLDGDYSVTRSIDIHQSPQELSEIISDFNTWPAWNPWLCLDSEPNMKIHGKGDQIGDVFLWQGEMIGSGEIEHLAIDPGKTIVQQVRFIEPFESKSEISFSIEPTMAGSTVSWEMRGRMPFLFRFLSEKMKPLIGMDYERGLKMLKEFAEHGRVSSKVRIDGLGKFDGLVFVGKSEICDKEELGEKMQHTFYEVGNWLVANSEFPNEAVSIYKQFNHTSNLCDYTSGYKLTPPYKEFQFTNAKVDSIPSGKVVKVTFLGDYQHLGNAWTAAYMYIEHAGLKPDPKRFPFEIYLNDPAFFPNPMDWVTEVNIPVK